MIHRLEYMKTLTILVLALVLFQSRSTSQEIRLSLDITMDKLSSSQRDYLQEFQSKLTAYVNEHKWTDAEFYGDIIPVTMSINFLSGTEGGEYSAQVAIASQRRIFIDGRPTENTSLILRVLDPRWSFTYIQGQPLYHDEYQFNDITSFVDYYMFVILGLDFDSMELMQGTTYYQRAATIAQRSQSSNRASEWQGQLNQYSRMNLIGEMQNAQYESFRTAIYWYYYEGLDYMATEKESAQTSIARALENIADALARTSGRALVLSSWLESKSSEFCTLLEGYTRKAQLMNTLIQVDPPRAEVYRRCNF